MHFGKYVCVLFYVLLMRPFRIPLRMDGWDQQHPKSNGIRLHLLWQMPMAKLLMLFFVVFLLMNSIWYLMWRPPKRHEPSLRPPTRKPRRSRTPNFKCLLFDLRKWRWLTMSHLIHFMGDSMRLLLTNSILERRLKTPKWWGKSWDPYSKAFRLRSPPLRRAKIWTGSRFKSLLALFKPMSSDCPLISLANHLLSKPEMRESMIPPMRMMLKKRWHIWQKEVLILQKWQKRLQEEGWERLIIISRDCMFRMQWPWASKERVSKLFESKG